MLKLHCIKVEIGAGTVAGVDKNTTVTPDILKKLKNKISSAKRQLATVNSLSKKADTTKKNAEKIMLKNEKIKKKSR